MQLIIVKRFLKGETPSIPLPPGVDELSSNPSTGSWLLVSQSPTLTREVECQTSPSEQALCHRPRARVKRFFGLIIHWGTRLCVFFCAKPKLPKLNYGGLQAPQLHCLATSSPSNSSLHIPQSVQYCQTNSQIISFTGFFQEGHYSGTINYWQRCFSSGTSSLTVTSHFFHELRGSHPNSFVKSTLPNFWTSMSIVLLTVSLQEAS